jgi:hypothetical protein
MDLMSSTEPTILTKWGRLTGAQWLEARHQEAMDAWWTPAVERYVNDHWPTPQQIEAHIRNLAQEKRAQLNRILKARAIADITRSDFQPRPKPKPVTQPQQLAIL